MARNNRRRDYDTRRDQSTRRDLRDRFNVFSIIGFILSFFGMFSILGIIFCIIALSQISHTGERGRGLAIAGIIIGAIILIASIAALIAFGVGISSLGERWMNNSTHFCSRYC